MKNSNETIGNRPSDLPACSVVPHPTAPPRAPEYKFRHPFIKGNLSIEAAQTT